MGPSVSPQATQIKQYLSMISGSAVRDNNQQIKGADCPALVLGPDNKPIFFCTAKANQIDIPIVRALRQGHQTINGQGSKGSGLSVCILGDQNGCFEGMGAVNSFAPDHLHIIMNPRVLVDVQVGALNYFAKLEKSKGTRFTLHHIQDIPKSPQFYISTQIERANPKDSHSAEINSAYDRIENVFSATQFPVSDVQDLLFKSLMLELHNLAASNLKLAGSPFAAAIIDSSGQLISVGSDRIKALSDPLMNAEVLAISRALAKNANLTNSILVSSTEPCIAAAEIAARVGVKKLLYGNTAASVRVDIGPLEPNFFSDRRMLQLRLKEAADFSAWM